MTGEHPVGFVSGVFIISSTLAVKGTFVSHRKTALLVGWNPDAVDYRKWPINLSQGGQCLKVVSFYELAPGALEKLKEHYPAHRARLEEFHARGVLLAAGPLGNPPESAMGIFASREAAEEFIKGDPFVINGLVGEWRVLEWNAAFL